MNFFQCINLSLYFFEKICRQNLIKIHVFENFENFFTIVSEQKLFEKWRLISNHFNFFSFFKCITLFSYLLVINKC